MEFINLIISVFGFFGLTAGSISKYALFGLILLGGVYLIFDKKLDKKIKPLSQKLSKIESFIIRLCGALESGGNISQIELYKAGSPLKLTEKGRQSLETIGFSSEIDANLEYVFSLIDKIKPSSALDAERASIGVINYIINEPEIKIFKKIEDFIYNHPEYNNLEYFRAAGLYLRDKYLERHPELFPE